MKQKDRMKKLRAQQFTEEQRQAKLKADLRAIREYAGRVSDAREASLTAAQRAAREDNRKRHPEFAAFVDQMREYFPNLTVESVSESPANRE